MPDGHRVSIGSQTPGEILVADFNENHISSSLLTPLDESILAHAWSSDGEFLAVSGENSLVVVNAESLSTIVANYPLDRIGVLTNLKWSSCGSYLAFTQRASGNSDWGIFEFHNKNLELIELNGIESRPTAIDGIQMLLSLR